MQEVKYQELCSVSAGKACVEFDMWEKVNQKAIRDGIMLSAIVVPITSAFMYSLSNNNLPLTAFSAVLVAPYVAGYGYFSSSAWSIFK